jgi:putative ABC transport system substrate-binding protein
MDRRSICRALVACPLLMSGPLHAQSARVARVAWVALDAPDPRASNLVNFRRGMQDRGWVEGRNLDLSTWWGHGVADKITAQVPAIVASRPEVVVAGGGPTIVPLLNGGLKLPTVFTMSGDPVASGLVASYAKPGGQLTGISFFMAELVNKRIETLREILPQVKRVAYVGWSRHAGEPHEVKVALDASAKAGLEAIYRPANDAADIEAAFAEFARWRADAILVFADGVTLAHAARIAALSRSHRIPVASGWAEFAFAGSLFSYGPNRDESFAHLASFVDRILKGAKPGVLPVERPLVHEFVINQKTARDLGIRIPPAVLARANQFVD